MDLDTNELLLTQKELEHRLGVSSMTIFYWRFPDKYKSIKRIKKIPALPCVITRQGRARHFIAFPYKKVKHWLVLYRPSIAARITKDKCNCSYCDKQRTIRATQMTFKQVINERRLQLVG
jgi:hypothetical protein